MPAETSVVVRDVKDMDAVRQQKNQQIEVHFFSENKGVYVDER
jgi:hypothetical protein